jgi:predicted MFS family arabinose efflux permease
VNGATVRRHRREGTRGASGEVTTSSADVAAAEAEPPARRGFVAALVYCGLCTSVVGSLGVLVIPTIADDMAVSRGAGQWILTAALLVGTVATPVLGALSDGPRRRTVLLGTLGLILVGSVLAATATSFAQLVGGRALQGLAYAVIPVTTAAARAHLPAGKVGRAVAAISITTVTGAGLSFPMTGLLVQIWSYRVAFWFAALFTGLALLAVWVTMPGHARRRPRGVRLDWTGAGLLSAALVCFVLAVSEGGHWGWSSPWVIALFAGAGVLFPTWVLVEVRTARPLVDLRSFRHREVALANLAAVGLGATFYAASSVVSQLLQTPTAAGYGFGLALLPAGLALLPMSAGSQVAHRIVRVLGRRVGAGWLLMVVPIFVSLNMAALAASHDRLWQILVGLFVQGMAIGASFVLMPIMILRAVPAEQTGSALAVNQVLRTLGGSLGSAAVAAVMTSATTAGSSLPAESGYTFAFVAIAVSSMVLVLALVAVPRAWRQAADAELSAPPPPPTKPRCTASPGRGAAKAATQVMTRERVGRKRLA